MAFHQGRLIEFLERSYHRQTADELRNQAEFDQVFRFDVEQQFGHIELAFGRFHFGPETDAAGFGAALLDDLVQAGKRATADEQHVLGVDLQELLLRMLAAALRRHRRNRAFDQLEQRLLHAFTGHIAGD